MPKSHGLASTYSSGVGEGGSIVNLVTVSIPTDVIIDQEKQLKVYSGSWIKSVMVGGLRWEELDAAGHVLSTLRKQRVTYAWCHSYPLFTYTVQDTSHRESLTRKLRLPTSSHLTKTFLTDFSVG